ncbi:MAG: hypothetical protein GX627_03070 [Parcubacteria group bacterium]|jgi:hypothetical protein|nr:hypothetical protein [Parcubacteria group bacterium]
MKTFKNKNNKGFIKIKVILIIIAILVVLKYVYDIDIVGFLTQGKFKELLDKFYNLSLKGWEKYKDTVMQVWNLLVGFIKGLFAKLTK